MADQPGGGSWVVVEELLERGDPLFVDELRGVHDAERLAGFAARWYADPRPHARQFLLDYLDRPLNAYRHEPLVKRLFKQAEAAGDDALVARFLVLFDRSLRRRRRKRHHSLWRQLNDRDQAHALVRQCEAEGAEYTNLSEWNGRFYVQARWAEEVIVTPRGTAMPREISHGRRTRRNPRTGERIPTADLMEKLRLRGRPPRGIADLPESARKKLQEFRLFTTHTRHYLRRRAWRYFRRLGKQHPERYTAGVALALKLYTDADAADGVALLDNWGLVHALFHHSPMLVAKTSGWTLAPDRNLAELAPAPMYPELWRAAPHALLDLMKAAHSRPVRRWAIRLLQQEGSAALAALPLDELLDLLSHEDQEVIVVASEALRAARGLESLSVERWLTLLGRANPAALDVLCELMATRLPAAQVTLEQAARLAAARPLPVARLGLTLLRGRRPAEERDCRTLLGLTEAQAELVRPEIVRWAREALGTSAWFQTGWVLEYLDGRHADVRAEGWAWMQEEPRARDDVGLWCRLLETPYDDVRLKLVAELERRVAGHEGRFDERVALDPELVRFLWASVLLNIHRGGKAKPLAVRQVVRRLERRPGEAASLLPILSVALRSVRGPEWRAGLAGVVGLVERNPDLGALVREKFPELKMELSNP